MFTKLLIYTFRKMKINGLLAEIAYEFWIRGFPINNTALKNRTTFRGAYRLEGISPCFDLSHLCPQIGVRKML